MGPPLQLLTLSKETRRYCGGGWAGRICGVTEISGAVIGPILAALVTPHDRYRRGVLLVEPRITILVHSSTLQTGTTAEGRDSQDSMSIGDVPVA
jgi:hypothetical protein